MNFPRRVARVLVAVTAIALGLCSTVRAQEARLVNIATRSQVGSGGNVLTVGFTITGTAKKTVLVRGVGPGLTALGFPGAVEDPTLTLYSGQTVIASNDNWGTPIGATSTVTTATFSAVGAFGLPAGSKDSSILISLDAGGYTAQMSSATGVTGLGIVEIYEMDSAGGKLTNLSTTGPIDTGGVMIAGLVIAPGSGSRKLLFRAAGPALTQLGVPGALPDPSLKITSSDGRVTYATNDNWGTPTDATALDATSLTTIAQMSGAFPFPANSKDAVAFLELAPGGYTVQITGTGAGGLATVEAYDLTPASAPSVTIAASKAAASEAGDSNGEFTVTRAGDTRTPLTVNYVISGTGTNGIDYAVLSNSVTIPAGAASAKISLSPYPDLQTEGTETVALTLSSSSSYTIGSQSSATVSIADSVATLYVAAVRPTATAVSSTASGTATILLSQSGTLAGISVSFSNLSSAETSAHLTLGTGEDFVFNLPAGQVSGTQWTFAPVGVYSSAALLAAVKAGNISVRIDTAGFPGGELKGTFIQGFGSQIFTAPAAPPAVSLTNVTATDAARFLIQATFGPKKSEIDALTGGSLDAWLDAQFALPYSSHRAAARADRDAFGGDTYGLNWNDMIQGNRLSAWYKHALTAPDQLRQRVTFALSELFVTSDFGGSFPEANVAYYDVLGDGAFGNFRTLLENVTLNPMMGEYLSLVRNRKANPITGSTPDENYAREVMQLFTVGLNKLQPDGTLQLGSDGLPIPTYDQATITETAKVLTGWTYYDDINFTTSGGFSLTSKITPMVMFAAQHENSAKTIINGTVVPANQGGVKDLQVLLDALFQHPNTGPFIARQLIQRLVTSNPSPAYVYRVAQKFADNGAGVRGDLKAVVRAILTDYEARSAVVAANPAFGKIKEPLLRLTGLLRAFNASSPLGRYLGKLLFINGVQLTGATPRPPDGYVVTGSGYIGLELSEQFLAQAALRSPSVFNFFHPDYVSPGALAAAGMVAPEMEITDETFAVSAPNFLQTYIFQNNAGGPTDGGVLTLDLTYEQTLANDPAALVDHLNRALCGGSLPAITRTRILTALGSLNLNTNALEKARTAVLLVATSPAGATQK